MKKLIPFLFFTVITCLVIGFNIADNNPTKTKINSGDNRWTPVPSNNSATAIYTDNMDGANDTTSLKNRGYKVFRRGPGPIGAVAIWFQGNITVFPAYNGPATGYVASNFNSAIGNNAIDNWLVLPFIAGGLQVGDSLYFFSQSPLNSTFPDSMKIMYSVSDSVPEGTWTMLGRFQVNVNGFWERKGFRVPTTSTSGRLAIRYGCVDGGPTGNNTDYSGIDAVVVERNPVGVINTNTEIPSSYNLSQNYPNPFNPSSKIKFQIAKLSNTKLVVSDILGKEVVTLVNEQLKPGTYEVDFDGTNLPSGIYFYKLITVNFADSKKMILVK